MFCQVSEERFGGAIGFDVEQGSLEALVPELLSAVPYDCMSAKPLRYHLKPDGRYVLYSVGPDGKDDGGDPSLSPGASPDLWGGRDVVWPDPQDHLALPGA